MLLLFFFFKHWNVFPQNLAPYITSAKFIVNYSYSVIQPKHENISGRGHQPFSGHTDSGVKTLFQHHKRKADVHHCVPQVVSTAKFCSAIGFLEPVQLTKRYIWPEVLGWLQSPFIWPFANDAYLSVYALASVAAKFTQLLLIGSGMWPVSLHSQWHFWAVYLEVKCHSHMFNSLN